MNAEEAVALARYSRAARPQQKWDEYTPDVWADALDDLRYEDAAAAVKYLVKNAAYVDVESIRSEVARTRSARIQPALSRRPPFPGDPRDVYTEQRWTRAWYSAIGDGVPIDEAAEAPSVRQIMDEAPRMLPAAESPLVRAKDVRPLNERVVPFTMPPRPERELEAKEAERQEAERSRQLRSLEVAMAAARADEPRGADQ